MCQIAEEYQEQQEQDREERGFPHPGANPASTAFPFALVRAPDFFDGGTCRSGGFGGVKTSAAGPAAIRLAVKRRPQPVKPLPVMRASYLDAPALRAFYLQTFSIDSPNRAFNGQETGGLCVCHNQAGFDFFRAGRGFRESARLHSVGAPPCNVKCFYGSSEGSLMTGNPNLIDDAVMRMSDAQTDAVDKRICLGQQKAGRDAIGRFGWRRVMKPHCFFDGVG